MMTGNRFTIWSWTDKLTWLNCLLGNCAPHPSPRSFLCATKGNGKPLTLGVFSIETVLGFHQKTMWMRAPVTTNIISCKCPSLMIQTISLFRISLYNRLRVIIWVSFTSLGYTMDQLSFRFRAFTHVILSLHRHSYMCSCYWLCTVQPLFLFSVNSKT